MDNKSFKYGRYMRIRGSNRSDVTIIEFLTLYSSNPTAAYLTSSCNMCMYHDACNVHMIGPIDGLFYYSYSTIFDRFVYVMHHDDMRSSYCVCYGAVCHCVIVSYCPYCVCAL